MISCNLYIIYGIISIYGIIALKQAARTAHVTQATPNFNNAFQASIIIRELFKELANRKRLNIADFTSGLAWTVATAGHGDPLCPLQ